MKLLQFNLVITIALIFASCHSHKQIVIVQPFNPHCAYEREGHPHKGDDAGCPHHLPDDNPYCRCGVEETLDESAIPPQDDNQSCGCGVAAVPGILRAPGVPREFIEDAIRGMPGMIAPQCGCGIDRTDEGDAALSMKQRKAILDQGLKLLDRGANVQPEAGKNDAGRAGEPAAQ